jgi:hypothetical protein
VASAQLDDRAIAGSLGMALMGWNKGPANAGLEQNYRIAVTIFSQPF